MYFIRISSKAKRDLKKLPNKEKILNKIYKIRINPFSHVVRLQGTRLWRLRVNDYRVVLDIIIKGREIIVLRVGHRKNVYKK